MPDLISHTLIIYPLTLNRFFRKFSPFLFLGAILPDLISRPWIIISSAFNFFPYQFWWFGVVMHTPIVVLLATILISFLFEEKERKKIFVATFIGSFSHLFLDSFQLHFQPAYLWFFPISFKTFEFGLFWPEESLFAIPILLILTSILLVLQKTRKAK